MASVLTVRVTSVSSSFLPTITAGQVGSLFVDADNGALVLLVSKPPAPPPSESTGSLSERTTLLAAPPGHH
jgi:hypothetical protein